MKDSKDGVDRKVLGDAGGAWRIIAVRNVKRQSATGLTGPKQALLLLQKQPWRISGDRLDKSDGDPHWEGQYRTIIWQETRGEVRGYTQDNRSTSKGEN